MMGEFEGFEGIKSSLFLWGNDTLLFLIFALLVCFAMVYNSNFILFHRMIDDILSFKGKKKGIDIGSKRWIVYKYCYYQMAAISSLLLLEGASYIGYFQPKSYANVHIFLLIIFIFILLFEAIKRGLNTILAWTFKLQEPFKLWRSSARNIMSIWGILLFFPAFIALLVQGGSPSAVTFFLLSYILARFLIFYKSIFIFHLKPLGYLFLCSYLCALEILPLYFMCKGTLFLYKIIETIITCH